MNDRKVLNEIALNQREVEHPDLGGFIIKRPTNRILSNIETARTKSSNRDLQSRDKIVDPETGQSVVVPAFLTRNAKMRLLKELGEWSDSDETNLIDAEAKYRDACMELNNYNFLGLEPLLKDYDEIFELLSAKAKEKKMGKKISKQLEALFPMQGTLDSEEHIYGSSLPQPPTEEEYGKAKTKIERTLKDVEVAHYLDSMDTLYRQYGLYLKGMAAQSELLMLRIVEIGLFADTIESRADYIGRLVKVLHCSMRGDEPVWETLIDCENATPELVNWLLGEIEKLERLDPSESEEDIQKRERFNFLSPLIVTSDTSEDSDDQRKSKQDGESQEGSE